mgnify:CR=1 FL=1
MYKNIEKQTKLSLKDQIAYQPGQVVSKTLVQNEKVSMTLFSFDKGEEISSHAAGGDAMVTVLEGTGRFTVGEDVFFLKKPAEIVVAVHANFLGNLTHRKFCLQEHFPSLLQTLGKNIFVHRHTECEMELFV